MIESIRKDLSGLNLKGSRANLSLLFNRLCPGIDGEGDHARKDDTITALVNGYTEPGYLPLYRHTLKQWGGLMEKALDTICFEMEVTSPLVVGKGDQNVHEFGITLQLPWGTPVIPGSAVKGVLSSFAHEQGDGAWHKGALAAKDNSLPPVSGEQSLVMFGGTAANGDSFAGCLDFQDAWWVPGKDTSPFMEDIINIHNRTYYQGEDRFPDGMDNPIPNKFVVIKPGERFLFAIRGSASWRGLAKEMLILAADEYGFGAKTRVGYGRLTYCKNAEDLRLEIPEAGDKALVEIYKVHKGNAQLHDTFRAETEKRFYCPELDLLFRKYKPACCFLADLEDKHPEQWRDVKKIHDQHKKMLKNAPIDPVDPVIQEIFERCRPLAPENIPPWFQAFAPTPAHYIAGKTAIEIQNFLEKYRKNWPPLADFKQAIETAMHLSDEDKEECLLILEMKMEEIAGKETGDG